MAKLTWDNIGERYYETGVQHGVLYVQDGGSYPLGVPWNGLTAVNESPSGAESTPIYADNMKYLDIQSAEEFGCTIEAYTYPPEFAECDGSVQAVKGLFVHQQNRKAFGFSYKTDMGNDVDHRDYGYKLHLVYNGKATPTEKSYTTVGDSTEPIAFSWEVTTTPIVITTEIDGKTLKPTAHLTLDSTLMDKDILKALEDILYGTTDTEARLPMPDEIIAMFNASATPTALTASSKTTTTTTTTTSK
ncbi:MAG: hypothetical protein R3Y53_02030 [Bacillota bacterium]